VNNLESISAQLAIMNLKARHLRLLDTKDWVGYGALLTDDFVLDLSAGTGIPIVQGRDAALKMIQAALAEMTIVHHAHLAEFDIRGDEALVVWPMQDRLHRGPDQPSMTGYGHHHDRWVRQNGEWRLASLRLTRLHVDVYPPAGSVTR
jgi:hypothetical protein